MRYTATDTHGRQLRPGGSATFGPVVLAWLKRRQKRNGRGLVIHPVSSPGDRIVAVAARDRDVREVKPNDGPRIRYALAQAFLREPAAWCAAIATLWVNEGGGRSPHTASVYEWEHWAREHGFWRSGRATAWRPGWGIVFDFPDVSGAFNHCGVLAAVLVYDDRLKAYRAWRVGDAAPTHVACWEGNTSPGPGGSQHDGQGVHYRIRGIGLVRGAIATWGA